MVTTLPGGHRRSAEELWHYEGLRIGSARAMRELVASHHAGMVRVARLYQPEDPEALVARTWEVALRGLGTFVWHTTFRSWLFGILVDLGRGEDRATASPAQQRILQDPATVVTVPPSSLAELPWTGWWGPGSWAALQAWLDARPRSEREAILLVDVLGWTRDDARDALGWTDAALAAMHDRVRDDLVTRIAGEMGVAGDAFHSDLHGIAGLLAELPAPPAGDPPPVLADIFRRWRRERGLTASKRLAGWFRVRRLSPPALLPV